MCRSLAWVKEARPLKAVQIVSFGNAVRVFVVSIFRSLVFTGPDKYPRVFRRWTQGIAQTGDRRSNSEDGEVGGQYFVKEFALSAQGTFAALKDDLSTAQLVS